MTIPVEYRYWALPLNGQGKRSSKVHIAATGADKAVCGETMTPQFSESTSAVPDEVCARCKPHAALVVSVSAKESMHRFREIGDNGRQLIDFPLTCRTPDCDEREAWGGFCEACLAAQSLESAA